MKLVLSAILCMNPALEFSLADYCDNDYDMTSIQCIYKLAAK